MQQENDHLSICETFGGRPRRPRRLDRREDTIVVLLPLLATSNALFRVLPVERVLYPAAPRFWRSESPSTSNAEGVPKTVFPAQLIPVQYTFPGIK